MQLLENPVDSFSERSVFRECTRQFVFLVQCVTQKRLGNLFGPQYEVDNTAFLRGKRHTVEFG
ncbi:MAG: hypothetical protein U0992_05485 [Planctomycetaceae bacterium]